VAKRKKAKKRSLRKTPLRKTRTGGFWSRRSALLVPPAVALVAAGGLLVADRETGLLPLLSVRAEVGAQRAVVEELARQRSRLRERVRLLRNDPLEIEAAAREGLGMARRDELVVRLPRAGGELDRPAPGS